MAADLTLRQGSTLPAFTATVKDQSGNAMDLTLATSVKFVMRQLQSASPTVNASMTVVSASTGQVQYNWAAADTATPGLYMAEIQVVLPSGAYTFPNVGYLSIEITPSLALASQQLITVEDAKDVLNFSTDYDIYDTKILRWVEACRPVIESIVGPVIQQNFDEWYDGGQHWIVLRHPPSTARGTSPVCTLNFVETYIGPIEYQLTPVGTPVTGSIYTYEVDTFSRVVRRGPGGGIIPFPNMPQSVHIGYTSGQQTVPDNVAQATRELLRVNFQHTQQRFVPGAGAQSADETEDRDMPAPPTGFFVPGRVYELLEPNRRYPALA